MTEVTSWSPKGCIAKLSHAFWERYVAVAKSKALASSAIWARVFL